MKLNDYLKALVRVAAVHAGFNVHAKVDPYPPPPTHAEALANLRKAQREFLLAFGWRYLDVDLWRPPPNYRPHDFARGFQHAVNTQLRECRERPDWNDPEWRRYSPR